MRKAQWYMSAQESLSNQGFWLQEAPQTDYKCRWVCSGCVRLRNMVATAWCLFIFMSTKRCVWRLTRFWGLKQQRGCRCLVQTFFFRFTKKPFTVQSLTTDHHGPREAGLIISSWWYVVWKNVYSCSRGSRTMVGWRRCCHREGGIQYLCKWTTRYTFELKTFNQFSLIIRMCVWGEGVMIPSDNPTGTLFGC